MTHHFTTLPSTNDEAVRIACECGAPEFDAVMADAQSAGRGRLGRAWSSPPGTGLYASVILRPRAAPEKIPVMTLLAGVAAAEAIREVSGLDAKIKWPNDILIKGKKVAGLLCEAHITGENAIVVAGLGVNVDTLPRDLPERPLYPATSLAAESGLRHEPVKILETWIRRLKDCMAKDLPDVLVRWSQLDALAGQRIRAGGIEGVNSGLDKEGHLLLKPDNGNTITISAGDVLC